ncbi:hypothetical protein [Sinorhizobium meliloti]|uniref:hypothetical protein n=1 Tax=Rhizobium meliloti TaxID=382 RepID=UPI0012A97DDE|nr:hypothetical protein [Sinorhizobium meliloti]QGJ74052.1 hypothetical protein C3L21_08520 [Sinorhizobium meliloti]
MRTERYMHKEAGVILSQLLKEFDHDLNPAKAVVEDRCRIIATRHYEERTAECVSKGMERSSVRREMRMVNALVDIALVSFWHRTAFFTDPHYDHVHGLA